MNRNRIIELIREQFLDGFYDGDWLRSMLHMKKWEFRQRSYSQWAAQEIISEIERRKNLTPLECVRDFRRRVDGYSCKNSQTSYIFSVAYDEAEAIEAFLISLLVKENRHG